MILKIKTLTIFLSILIVFNSCTGIRQGIALLRTPDKFISLNDSVHFENQNDSVFASQVNKALQMLIDSVELKHYRQSMLFVAFLVKGKDQAFEKLMRSIVKKEPFPKAIGKAYGMKVTLLWDKFIEEIRKSEKK